MTRGTKRKADAPPVPCLPSKRRKTSSLPASTLPHVLELVLAAADYPLLLSFRATSKAMKVLADRYLARHVVLQSKGFTHASGRRLPFLRAGPLGYDAGEWRANVRVLDVGCGGGKREWFDIRSLNYLHSLMRGLTQLRVVRLHHTFPWPSDVNLAPGATIVALPTAPSPSEKVQPGHCARPVFSEATRAYSLKLRSVKPPCGTTKAIVHVKNWGYRHFLMALVGGVPRSFVVVFSQTLNVCCKKDLLMTLELLPKIAAARGEDFRITIVDPPAFESAYIEDFPQGTDIKLPLVARRARIQELFSKYLHEHLNDIETIEKVLRNLRILTLAEYRAKSDIETFNLEMKNRPINCV